MECREFGGVFWGQGVACDVFDGSDGVCCGAGGHHPGAIVCGIEKRDVWSFVHFVHVVFCLDVVCRVRGLCRWRCVSEVVSML